MRKLPLIIGIIIGAAVGLLTSITDGVGVRIVMMSIGAVVGAAIGGAFSKIKRRQPVRPDSIPGMGSFSEEQMRNYWRDKGEIYPAPGHPDPEGARGEFDRLDG